MAEIENLKIGSGGTIHIVGNEDIVAEAWAVGQSYVKDKSYVINNHVLYVCNTSHTSVSPFDPTNWTQITVGESLGDMLSAIPASASDLPYAAGVSTADAIGVLSNLDTSTQTSLVAAINELVATSKLNPVYGNTASGAIATFDTSLALPLQDCTIAINAVQTGTLPPSPSNVCPISGFTGANINDKGINLCEEVWENGTLNTNTGVMTPDANSLCSKNYNPIKEGIVISLPIGSSALNKIIFFDGAYNVIDNWGFNANSRRLVTVNAGTKYFKLTLKDYGGTYNNDISVNYPATVEAYHAYNANSTTTAITWQSEAGTVYGGSLDVTSGVLTVTHGYIDLGSISWDYTAQGYGRSSTAITNPKLPASESTTANIICECLVANSANQVYSHNEGIAVDSASRVRVYWSTMPTTGSDIKSALNGQLLVYELATPQTYQLTPTQISAIVGTNNIFTDTNGNTSVVYACSLKDYIEGQ